LKSFSCAINRAGSCMPQDGSVQTQIILKIWTEKNTEERETVKLSCSYSTNSQYVRLYWYKQYPNREPEYLLLKNARSASDYEHTSDHRFQLTALHTSTELTITDVRLSDSALYYCALRVGAQTTVTGNSVTPY
uniref:Ig-like domain-containing protein n=1 Tax=Sinocyclocheilus rhinocerous TaxID=307959 RepID=A0A673N988_9TELE